MQAVAKWRHVLLQGASQRQAIGCGEDQVARGLRLAPLQHARVKVGGEVQFVRHSALEGLQHQQLVVGIDTQDTDGADAAFAIASIGRVFAGDVVGEASQIIELGVAVGFLQRAEVDGGCATGVFAGIVAGGFIGAR
ncbi:hypothetical protein D3C76_812890 [compost metagenome]